ncbi:carbohydrate ABC transporter permease [Streptomyces sp. 891-h]|uniref:carbohydrate ABC transporter permease n=1 Tax=Streptomyces sp. 891-h TaxID=2720714 RepID=UPI001FAAADD4|nr:carbohydrate ABC transporter permease [Streptomyces sp. 891-h]UNZ16248.1 carbohydrate ABC transporter permease [Streptomyces sp. 891-h]
MATTLPPTTTEPAPSAPPAGGSPVRRRPGPSRGKGSPLLRVPVLVGLLLFAAAVVYPLTWMVMTGFKENAEVFGRPWGLPDVLRWENFAAAWEQGIVRYLTNSVIVTAASIVCVTLFSAWAAYGLTRLRVPFSQPILLLILGGLMISPTVALIPLFRLLQLTDLYDTRWALIILYTAFRIPFTVFLIRAYMLGLPREIEEAALIDGASRRQVFWRIVFPLCRPILASAALLQALFAWNEFPFALVFVNDDGLKTLPVGLVAMQSRLLTDWPVMFAALTVACLPLVAVFLLGQRHFIRGLAEGTGK